MSDKTTKAKGNQPETTNHNKRYLECKIEVKTVMKPDGYGGEKLRHHIGEIGKPIKTVCIEPKRAEQLNRTWDSRLIIYWPEGDPMPASIRRTPIEDEDGNPTWNDETMINGKWSMINSL